MPTFRDRAAGTFRMSGGSEKSAARDQRPSFFFAHQIEVRLQQAVLAGHLLPDEIDFTGFGRELDHARVAAESGDAMVPRGDFPPDERAGIREAFDPAVEDDDQRL